MITQTILKRRILVADSDFESRLAMSAALSGDGFSIDTVSNGLAAFTKISEGPPDMLLVTPELEGIGSLELCRLVRESHEFPIVFYAGFEEIAYKLEAFEIGVDDFIINGTQFEEVTARIKAIFRRTESRRQFAQPPTSLLSSEQTGSASQHKKIRAVGKRFISKLTHRYRNRPREYDVGSVTAVLVADANLKSREKACRLLKTMGYFAMEAESAGQTLLTAGKYDPKLILVDLVMPDLNGLELLNVLRTHPKTSPIKIIVVSGRGDPDTVHAAREIGIEDYIVKPWDPNEFEIRVRWALESVKQERAA